MVTPVLQKWSYLSLALSHGGDLYVQTMPWKLVPICVKAMHSNQWNHALETELHCLCVGRAQHILLPDRLGKVKLPFGRVNFGSFLLNHT